MRKLSIYAMDVSVRKKESIFLKFLNFLIYKYKI